MIPQSKFLMKVPLNSVNTSCEHNQAFYAASSKALGICIVFVL